MIEFRHVLCPIDFSETSVRALAYATALAASYKAQLEVLHVIPRFEDVPGRSASIHQSPQLLEAIEAQMHQLLESVGAAGVNAALRIEQGSAHRLIVERARLQPADLVVMGTHGRSGFDRLLLGSVTEKVLRRVPCPVLTVPPGAASTSAAVAFTRILCAIDYSPASLAALRYALELGRQATGCVTVLYALEYMDPEEPCEHVDFDIRRRRRHFLEHAEARLTEQLAGIDTTGCEVKPMVAVDRAYKAVLQHAVSWPADLIVMGAQGTSGLELMLYGSNTQHVLRAAPCPVLTTPAPAASESAGATESR